MNLHLPDWFNATTVIPVKNRKRKGLPGLQYPIWTENKANLIQRYLQQFIYVTHHGTYIDAFAGPQRTDRHEMWAAKLVLDIRPRFLQHFHLFERDAEKITALQQLRDNQPPLAKGESKRTITIYPGDCNTRIKALLKGRPIPERQATFCLLDQWTFECDWATVVDLARYKREGNKIELFYFLANGWIDRAQSRKATNPAEMERWWGGVGWKPFFELRRKDRQKMFSARFKDELGYKHVRAFPIYKRSDGGLTMYWMIHATDHDEAPVLMNRAYRQVLKLKDPTEQPPLLECEVSRRPVGAKQHRRRKSSP